MTPDLDDYLAGLGISEGEAAPRLPRPGPDLGALWAEGAPAPQPVAPAAAPELLRAFLQGLADRAFPGLTAEPLPADGERVRLRLTGPNAERAAGRGGERLHAAETLCHSLLARHGLQGLRVQLDAGDYRQQQQGRLFALAARIADAVASSGEPHRMQPMNPAERRLMHLALQDHPLVYTESEGQGAGRHLVVYPRK